jgi:hypothetical protein
VACPGNLITPDKSIPSRLGLYANGLPGVTLSLFDDLTKDEQEDYLEFWDDIYQRSWDNFASDVQTLLADKFHIDLKLISRETSKYQAGTNEASGLAGALIEFPLSRYSRFHLVSISVKSNEAVDESPGAAFPIYDDEDGNLIDTVYGELLVVGLNEVGVNQDFETQTDKIFVAFDPAELSLKKTENRYFDTDQISADKLSCSFPCGYGEGSVRQINGGGVNVKFNIYCSIAKVICENINLFRLAFWYRIGVELMIERRLTDRMGRFVNMTEERAVELMGIYQGEYDKHLKNSVRSLSMREDPVCFQCGSIVDASTVLP